VAVLGSVTGGTGLDSGRIMATTAISKVGITGDLAGGSGNDSGQIAGVLGNINIHGNLTGNSGISSGAILSRLFGVLPEGMGSLAIGGNVQGGDAGVAASKTTSSTAGDSGFISAASAKSIYIAGSLIGGTAGTGTNSSGVADQTADTSGAIEVSAVGSLTINENVTGESGPNSGVITGSSIAKLKIGGNITGGTVSDTGEITLSGTLGNAVIKGNLAGNGSTGIDSTTAVVGVGYLQAGRIGTLDIKGNVTSGANSGGEIANSGAIRSSGDISSLTIEGAITGTATNPVYISAQEGVSKTATPKSDVAIKSVTVGGTATYLDLLAGYSPAVSKTTGSTTDPAGAPLGTPFDGAAQMGAITFKSDLVSSNVVAGAQPDSNGQFGTTGDSAFAPASGKGNLYSIIASIVVDGAATGNLNASDSFGFVAQEVASVKIGSFTVPLHPGAGNDLHTQVNGNLYVVEVASP
jgi:hypothetical protein